MGGPRFHPPSIMIVFGGIYSEHLICFGECESMLFSHRDQHRLLQAVNSRSEYAAGFGAYSWGLRISKGLEGQGLGFGVVGLGIEGLGFRV